MFCFGLAWLIFPIENRFYQKIVKNRTYYFPQIDFHNLRPLDPIRGLIQLSFLMFVAGSKEDAAKRLSHSTYASRFFLFRWVNHIFKRINRGTRMIAERVSKKLVSEGKEKTGQHKPQHQKLSLFKKIFVGFLLAIGFVLYVLCITQPFSLEEQVIFLLILGVIALTLFQAQTRFTLLMLIVISVIVSSRYVWWRYSETLNPNSYTSVIFTWLLIIAETYAFIVMLLGYFQVCWVLDRKPASLPKDKERWPSVDIFIPTYNEPLDVVKPTVYAALTVDWPKEKLNVYILDDGSRKEFKDFACEVGAGYIEREEHKHAKAGNINHAMGITKGDFIAIFDCDHVPVKTFLQKTMGWFLKDEKIALVQTPHHFYSQDPFEKNLHLKENVPNENSLFHDFIQKGNDTWNATMFCGSCAIMRRKALEEVGGIAVETVTEDAHTSLKLNRRGWSSAFLSTPLSAGLSTETLAAHIGQRIRWARGMVQIFRLDNPLFGKGLTIPQRLCFLNAMIHFLHGLPRIIFLIAPLPFLFANIYVIYASAIAIFVYLIPHMVHSTMTTYMIHRGYRFPFISALYETILSWYIFVPTLVALIAPHKGKFNVTAKGGVIDKEYLDWAVARPYFYLLLLNLAGFFIGLYRMVGASAYEVLMLLINLGWIIYNLIILFAAMAVTVESVQKRKFPRVSFTAPVHLQVGETSIPAVMSAFSQKDCVVDLKNASDLSKVSLEEPVKLVFGPKKKPSTTFDCTVTAAFENGVVELLVSQPTRTKEMEYVECTFGTPDIWIQRQAKVRDYGMFDGFFALLHMARMGAEAFAHFSNPQAGWFLKASVWTFKWVISFIPRVPSLRRENKNSPFEETHPLYLPKTICLKQFHRLIARNNKLKSYAVRNNTD